MTQLSRTFQFALFAYLCAAFFALELLVTYDGHLYVDLAQNVFTPAAWATWDMLRTPLFPVTLAVAFVLLGLGALAIKLLHVAVLGAVVAAWGRSPGIGRRGVVAFAVLLVFSPTVLVYASSLLSEVFVAASLAGVVLLAGCVPFSRGGAVMMGVGGALLYYVKPSFLYIFPLVAAAWSLYCAMRESGPNRAWRAAVERAGLTLIVFLAAVLPWHMRLRETGRMDNPSAFFAIKFGLFPQKRFTPAQAEEYARIHRDQRLPMVGSLYLAPPDWHIFPLLGELSPETQAGVYGAILREQPLRYLNAMFGTSLVLLSPLREGEDDGFLRTLTTPGPSANILSGPEHLRDFIRERFLGKTHRDGFLLRTVGSDRTWTVYGFLKLAGFCALPLGIWYGWTRRRKRMFLLSAAAFLHFWVFVAALVAANRYYFPVYFLSLLVVAEFVLILSDQILARVRSSRQERAPAVYDPGLRVTVMHHVGSAGGSGSFFRNMSTPDCSGPAISRINS